MSAQPAVATARVTADQLLDMPADGVRRELVEGEVREMTPAGYEQGRIALRIGGQLEAFARAGQLGDVVAAETGFRLSRDPDTVRAPDAAFIAADRVPPRAEQQRFVDLAPDLVVEVVSPSDRAGEVVEKALAWLSAGTALVWVVYPAQRLVVSYTSDAVLHVTDGEVLDGGEILPGLHLAVSEVFD